MEKKNKPQTNPEKAKGRRYALLIAVIAVLFGAIIWQLVQLQIRDGADYYATAESKKNKTYTLKGERGRILDRNGNVLAYDKPSYDVEFYRDPSKRKAEHLHAYTQTILQVIDIVEKNGGQTISGFSLKFDEDGEPYFDFLTENEETFKKREELWKSNMYVASKQIDEIYDVLLARYGIEELDEETQVKVLSIWQEVQMNAFLAKPVKIAINVNFDTVAQIEAAAVDMPGISIAESTYRVYPWGSLAAHVIGYTGSISENNLEGFLAKGYSADDKVGVFGIEYTMEEQLTGNVSYRQGTREVEVDANGAVMREQSYTAPIDGNNVVLSIDIQMQQRLEQSLRENIELIAGQIQPTAMEKKTNESDKAYKERLADYAQQIENRNGRPIERANAGAAVVMNVNTGEILATSSYPTFDPNDFIKGMSTEEYNEKYNDGSAPLYNRAISTKDTPGSIFKMVTALAGLMEGVVDVNTQINSMEASYPNDPDGRVKKGYFVKYTNDAYSPGCWQTHSERYHNHMNVENAVKESCNYYFYNITDMIGINKLVEWAGKFGLTSKTGIELANEATGTVGNQQILYSADLPITGQRVEKANIVARAIMNLLNETAEDLNRSFEQEKVEDVTKQLMDLVLEHKTFKERSPLIRSILMTELGLSSYEIETRQLLSKINNYQMEILWNENETVLTGIGQSITQITPIGAVRYISAVANGGSVMQAQIVKRILSNDGATVMEKEPVVVNHIDGAEEYLKVIRDGMKGVISSEDGGTAKSYWDAIPSKYKDNIGAKTGTAQINLIDIENSAWFVGFTPFEDPEIAIVVFISHGYSGGAASMTCQNVFLDFLDKMEDDSIDTIAAPGQLLP